MDASNRSRGSLSRRQFMQAAVLGTASLSVFGLSSCTPEPKLSDAAKLTCLGGTITMGRVRVSGLPYKQLAAGPGESVEVGQDLAKAHRNRAKKRKALLAFGHITDMHIVDGAAPGRMEFLRPYTDSRDPYFKSAGDWRPQEMLTVQVMDSMVRKLNAIGEGPVGGRKLDFVVSTGDTADARLASELAAAINILNGKPATANTVAGGYEGVQDNTSAPDKLWATVWHPEPTPAGRAPDDWTAQKGYPSVPGYLNAAVVPVQTQGTNVPWYAGFGNHDALEHGGDGLETGRSRLIRMLNIGDTLPVALPDGQSYADFAQSLAGADDAALKRIIAGLPSRKVTPSPARRPFSKAEFIRAHLDNPGPHGPAGHGFAEENAHNTTAYYRFQMAPGVVGFMLDTTNPTESPYGYLGDEQMDWLESELQSVSSRSYSPTGQLQAGTTKDQLAIVFSHHTSTTFVNPQDGTGASAGSLSGPAFLEFLGRFPNVVAWVNGHEHKNQITGHPSTSHSGGFWEINTAAHIDYPQQSRIIELFDNGDGTLSIITVLFDHADPGQITYDGAQTPASLAALSLELAMNQPGLDLVKKTGKAADRNAELLLTRPFGG